jgi:hypothetical protein
MPECGCHDKSASLSSEAAAKAGYAMVNQNGQMKQIDLTECSQIPMIAS